MLTILAILSGAMLARMFVRARLRRLWAFGGGGGCGRGGGGCGRFGRRGRRRSGPIDLGAPDPYRQVSETVGFDNYGWGWQQWRRQGPAATAALAKPAARVDVTTALELSARQKALYDEVLLKARAVLPAHGLAEALIAVGREPFGRDAVEVLVGHGELADDFEQLHHSLTPEQREKLRQVTGA
jgi:hypothetical protein